MEDLGRKMKRTSLWALGHFLTDTDFACWDEEKAKFSAEAAREQIDDALRRALKNGGRELEERAREVVEEAWEKGELIGFMEGMRAGAQVVLALLGEGEILI